MGREEREEGKLGNWAGNSVSEGPGSVKQQAERILLLNGVETFPNLALSFPSGLKDQQGQKKGWGTVSAYYRIMNSCEFKGASSPPFLWSGILFSAQLYPLFSALHLVSS